METRELKLYNARLEQAILDLVGHHKSLTKQIALDQEASEEARRERLMVFEETEARIKAGEMELARLKESRKQFLKGLEQQEILNRQRTEDLDEREDALDKAIHDIQIQREQLTEARRRARERRRRYLGKYKEVQMVLMEVESIKVDASNKWQNIVAMQRDAEVALLVANATKSRNENIRQELLLKSEAIQKDQEMLTKREQILEADTRRLESKQATLRNSLLEAKKYGINS